MADFKMRSALTMGKLQDAALIHLAEQQLWKLSEDFETPHAAKLCLCEGRKTIAILSVSSRSR